MSDGDTELWINDDPVATDKPDQAVPKQFDPPPKGLGTKPIREGKGNVNRFLTRAEEGSGADC